SYADTPVLPVINGEPAYEMLNDSLPTEWTRRMFWLCMMNGACGHTYGANGIWQCNRRDTPHGASPTGGDYGHIPWDESMNLPGSEQMGFGKKLLESFSWEDFQPHPEWAAFTGGAAAENGADAADPDDIYGPQSAGIPGMVRMIYVPESRSVQALGLNAKAAYSAFVFDPVTGVRTPAPEVRPDGDGSWTCPPPAGHDHDWVLVLEG
ncbi:MAG: glycoside hydrolase family 140 protein, partial [Chloroflexi bacterium]|nr:glycoside hydrolase family 140 protein [Chloroflexota bacterium]